MNTRKSIPYFLFVLHIHGNKGGFKRLVCGYITANQHNTQNQTYLVYEVGEPNITSWCVCYLLNV